MCHTSVLTYALQWCTPANVKDATVLEVGSYDVNGSTRPNVMRNGAAKYVGIDIRPGPGVDMVCSAEQISTVFGAESFDVVISTEMLEHCEKWREAIVAMKDVLRPGGLLLLTARGPGFPLHEHPHDWWRFTPSQFETMFADFDVLDVRPDPEMYGSFIVARKPVQARSAPDLSVIQVQSAPSQ